MTNSKICWNDLNLPPINLWNLPKIDKDLVLQGTKLIYNGEVLHTVSPKALKMESLFLFYLKDAQEKIKTQKEKYGYITKNHV